MGRKPGGRALLEKREVRRDIRMRGIEKRAVEKWWDMIKRRLVALMVRWKREMGEVGDAKGVMENDGNGGEGDMGEIDL